MHIEYAHYLHLQKRNHSMAKSGISNLTLKLAKGFGKKSQAVFKTSATTNEIVDLLRLQWSMYQIEEIPPSMYLTENELSKRENHHQTFYWKYALDYLHIVVYLLTKVDQRASMSESTPIGMLTGRWQMKTAF